MNISVTAPFGHAFERTKLVLFKDFQLVKWLTLGFCAWLAALGEGGGGGIGGNSWSPDAVSEGIRSVEDNLESFILIGIGVSAAVVFFIVLANWLRARGTFMFFDGIVRNRGAVKEPWHEFRERGNRLFVANVVLGLGGLLLVVTPIIIGSVVAWSDLRDERFEAATALGLAIAVLGALIPIVAIAIVSWLLRNFVAPTMYLHDLSVMDAWRKVKAEVISPNYGTIGLFLLMRIVIAMAIGTIVFASIFLTCCTVAIPYIGTVILLPLFVFERSYVLYFLEQFGDDWRFFREPEVAVETAWADTPTTPLEE